MNDEKERAIKILNSYKQHTRGGSLETVFDLAISAIQRNEAAIARCRAEATVQYTSEFARGSKLAYRNILEILEGKHDKL